MVFRCRREGLLLQRDQIIGEHVRGELRVHRKGMKRVAVLLAPDGEHYLLPLLDKVKLLAMNERGLLLTGVEVFPARGAKGNGLMFPQTWWCLLDQGGMRVDECPPVEARARERAREARGIGESMAREYRRRGRGPG